MNTLTPVQINETIQHLNNEISIANKAGFAMHDDPYVKNLLTALEMAKGNVWQPIDHDDVRSYIGKAGLYGIWVTTNRTGEKQFESYKLYLDDVMTMRTADDFADYHSEWAFNDYEYFMPLQTPPKESE